MKTPQAITTHEKGAVLDQEAVDAFASRLRGLLTRPEDGAYDAARTLYSGMIDERPARIARCRNVADVIASVNFARENDLLLAVHGCGHNGPGHALCDGGLVIDLTPMSGVRVDPEARIARVEGGATWGDVDHATHAFGLATVSGVISTTGVGGLTLGGGHGYLTRKYGLTIDNLLSADVVLADGSFVTASEESRLRSRLAAPFRTSYFTTAASPAAATAHRLLACPEQARELPRCSTSNVFTHSNIASRDTPESTPTSLANPF